MRRARFWILCAMGTLVVMTVSLIFGVRLWLSDPESLLSMLPTDVDMRLANMTIGEAGDGNRSMTINADTANYYKTKDIFILHKVSSQFIIGQNIYLIEADNGIYNQSTQVVELSGSVRAVNQSHNGILSCEAVTIKMEEDLIIGDNPFCYSTPTLDLEGNSFTFNSKDNTLLVNGRTHLLF